MISKCAAIKQKCPICENWVIGLRKSGLCSKCDECQKIISGYEEVKRK